MYIYAVCRRQFSNGQNPVLFWNTKPYGTEEYGLPSGKGHRRLLRDHPYRQVWVKGVNAPNLDKVEIPSELMFIAPKVDAGPHCHIGDICEVLAGMSPEQFEKESFLPTRQHVIQALETANRTDLLALFLGQHVCCVAPRRTGFPAVEDFEKLLR